MRYTRKDWYVSSSRLGGKNCPYVEISWFCTLRDEDCDLLGATEPMLASVFGHCLDVMVHTETGGYDLVVLAWE